MPEYVRALFISLVLSLVVFAGVRRPLGELMPPNAFTVRRNASFALLVLGFLAPSFWVYALGAAAVVTFAKAAEHGSTPAPLFLALMFIVPPIGADIPGLGLIKYLVTLDHVRLLSLLLLLPACFQAARGRASRRGAYDKVFLAFFALQAGLEFARSESFTNGLRVVLYVFIDVFLPYFVISRSVRETSQLRDCFAAFCMAAFLLAVLGSFEWAKGWLLFRPMLDHWRVDAGLGNYLTRGGFLRASATTGQPIVLAYVLALAATCWVGVRQDARGTFVTRGGLFVLLFGCFSTLSRGPWIGAAAALLVYWMTANAARVRVGVMGGLAATVAWASGATGLFPALKDVDASTVQYRQELLTSALKVFWRSPWLGSSDFVQQLDALGMRQGQGIVDVVNTYIQVALASGGIGLGLFSLAFLLLFRAVWKARKPGDEHASMRRMLLGAYAGILVTIATTSSISVIPWLYWAFAGLGGAYVNLQQEMQAKPATVPA